MVKANLLGLMATSMLVSYKIVEWLTNKNFDFLKKDVGSGTAREIVKQK
jgi:hypothetical protein